jgi:hypothetical protein
MKSKKYFLSLVLLLSLIVWGLSSQSIKVVQAAVKTAAPTKTTLVKKTAVKKAPVKKAVVKKAVVKKAVVKKAVVKKAPVKKATNGVTWAASGTKQLSRITNPFVRAAYKTKVEKYALGKKIKTITAAVVNGMHE